MAEREWQKEREVEKETSIVSERQREGQRIESQGERKLLVPLSVPIVDCGPCGLNSYGNRQLKVRRDNTKPT